MSGQRRVKRRYPPQLTAKIAKGDPRNPMSETEVTEKFLSNARLAISEKQTKAVIYAVNRLEAVENV